MRIGVLKMQARRYLAVPEGQRDLDQAGDARGGLEVTQIGLDRSERARLPRRTFDAQHRAQGSCLDGIAQQSTRAMGLDVVNLARRDSGLPVGFPQDRLLGQRIRRHEPVASSVLVHGAAANDGMDRIAIRQSPRERLQHDDAGTLAANIAIRPGVEGFAASVRRPGAGVGKVDCNRRREDQVHAAGPGQGGLAAPQAAAGEMDRDERGGAGRVDGQTRDPGNRANRRFGWPRC